MSKSSTVRLNGSVSSQSGVEDQPATASTTQPVPHPNTTTQLPCPDDPSQALAWLTSEQLVLSPLYDSLPPPDATKLQELAAGITHHVMPKNLRRPR